MNRVPTPWVSSTPLFENTSLLVRFTANATLISLKGTNLIGPLPRTKKCHKINTAHLIHYQTSMQPLHTDEWVERYSSFELLKVSR